MAWKQDLEKLKQQLAPEEEVRPVAKPLPKPAPAPKPQGPVSLDDEDSVFLSAMGLKASAPRPVKAAPAPGLAPEAAQPPPAPETFEEALKDLKGLKPMARGIGQTTPAPTPPPLPLPPPNLAQAEAPPPSLAPPPPPPVLPVMAIVPAPASAPAPATPMRFQLAAGMALEVDGMLDLRGHTVSDAMERLKDRLGDGMVLGWRSLQVILGPDPRLHEGLLDLLASGQAPMVARYAQAPVPMGGNQAWLLYFSPSQPPS